MVNVFNQLLIKAYILEVEAEFAILYWIDQMTLLIMMSEYLRENITIVLNL